MIKVTRYTIDDDDVSATIELGADGWSCSASASSAAPSQHADNAALLVAVRLRELAAALEDSARRIADAEPSTGAVSGVVATDDAAQVTAIADQGQRLPPGARIESISHRLSTYKNVTLPAGHLAVGPAGVDWSSR